MNILAAIAADTNVDPALRTIFAPAGDTRNLLTRRAAIQDARRFESEPLTGFGELPAHQVTYSEAWWKRREEVMDEEKACQRDDERAERDAKGE